ncbi:uncharacterized protein LOC144362649 [Saccoglossus kowalevskii]
MQKGGGGGGGGGGGASSGLKCPDPNGKLKRSGQSYTDDDGCTVCTCDGATGVFDCDNSPCDTSGFSGSSNSGCLYNTDSYKVGAVWEIDQCGNSCTCVSDGVISCTADSCFVGARK